MEQWRKNMYVLWLGQFLVMAGMTMIIPFLPLYIQELGVTDEKSVKVWAAFIYAANFLTAAVFSPIWGRLADRYGRKIMVLRSGYLMAVIIMLFGFATNVYQVLALRLLNGMISGFTPSGISIVASSAPKDKVGYALGFLQSGAVAGTIMGPLIGGLMVEWFGFRTIFNVTGLLLFAATTLVLFLVKESFKPDLTEDKGSMGADLRSVFQIRQVPSFFAVTFIIQFSLLSSMPLLPLFVQELQPGGSYIALLAGLVGAVTGLANMLFSPRLGRLGDRIGSEKVLLFCMLGASLVFIPHAFVTALWQLYLLRFMLGIAIGGLNPSVNALLRRSIPQAMVSRVYGFNTTFTCLGNLAGPLIGGLLATKYGIQGVFVMSSAFLLVCALWVNLKLAAERERGSER